MHYIRNWPEGLFILLVLLLPLALTGIWPPVTFLGFLARLALGMLIGFLVWIGIVVNACILCDRRKE